MELIWEILARSLSGSRDLPFHINEPAFSYLFTIPAMFLQVSWKRGVQSLAANDP